MFLYVCWESYNTLLIKKITQYITQSIITAII